MYQSYLSPTILGNLIVITPIGLKLGVASREITILGGQPTNQHIASSLNSDPLTGSNFRQVPVPASAYGGFQLLFLAEPNKATTLTGDCIYPRFRLRGRWRSSWHQLWVGSNSTTNRSVGVFFFFFFLVSLDILQSLAVGFSTRLGCPIIDLFACKPRSIHFPCVT